MWIKFLTSDLPGTSPTYRQFRTDIALVVTIILVVNMVRGVFDLGKDSTDSPGSRSGMELRIDYQTSCHYLESSQGILIPRLTAEGNHLCKQE